MSVRTILMMIIMLIRLLDFVVDSKRTLHKRMVMAVVAYHAWDE